MKHILPNKNKSKEKIVNFLGKIVIICNFLGYFR